MKSRPSWAFSYSVITMLPFSRLENSLLCKMEISAPLSIPLMTRPPLCSCGARLCLLFADVLSDCCVCFANSGPLGKFPLLAHESRLHAFTTRSVGDRTLMLTHTCMQMLTRDSRAHRYFYTWKSVFAENSSAQWMLLELWIVSRL